jgi:hypothetical protein
MGLVRANDKNNTKATTIPLVFYMDLLPGSKYGDTHAVKKNMCRYCIQLLIVIIKTLLNTLNTEDSYKETVA